MPKKESIWLRPVQDKDVFGDPVGPAPEWREVPGATVVPRGSSDFEQRGPVIVKGFMVVVPSSVAVEDTDDVKIRGEEQEIDGAVGDYGRKKIFYTIRIN